MILESTIPYNAKNVKFINIIKSIVISENLLIVN